MKASKIRNEKSLVKFINNFKKSNYTLTGITKQIKGSEFFADIKKASNLTNNLLTAKNVSYFLKFENKDNREFTIDEYVNLLYSLDSYLLNGYKVSELNCRIFQLITDNKRVQKSYDATVLKIDSIKTEISNIKGIDDAAIIDRYKLTEKQEKQESNLIKYSELLNQIAHSLTEYTDIANKKATK